MPLHFCSQNCNILAKIFPIYLRPMKMNVFSNTILLVCFVMTTQSCSSIESDKNKKADSSASATAPVKETQPWQKPIDTALFDARMKDLANGDTTGKWPVKPVYPLAGAILPFNRIVAYYGNLYSTRMGILGELPKNEMLAKLKGECKKWQNADSSVPVIPALHYVSVTAQGAPGKDGKYRSRMPFSQIDTIVNWANEIKGLAFLDIQVAHSTVGAEVPMLEKYLMMPNVHLGIDPEFSMKNGERPGTVIGTFNADDINVAIDYLAALVKKNNLPPKILVVHRFTQGMVRQYQNIKKLPEVQVVIDMDGWGDKILKKSSYLLYVYKEPVQYTGFKLFYKNDIKKGGQAQFYSPEELLKFTPKPIYIQYQ